MMFSQRSTTLLKHHIIYKKIKKILYMVVNLVEIKCHVFLDLDYYFHHFCSQVIGTFQERAINDAL